MRDWSTCLPPRRGLLAWLCCAAAALGSPSAAAGELQQRLQWDSSLSLRGLLLLKQARLLSWQGDYYTDGGWSAFARLQRSLAEPVGTYALGGHYNLAAGPGELQLGGLLQAYTGSLGLERWNYQQLNASWLTERCALSVSWTLETSAAAELGYKGPALDVACLLPLHKRLGLEFGLGAMGLRASSSQRFAHAGLAWNSDRLELRLAYLRASGSSRERYPPLAEGHWNASATWRF